ncbi:MAG: hypothetical protein ACRYHA_08545 [Janthinobacterium lividum]
MGSLDINHKRSFRPGRAALAMLGAPGAPGVASFYFPPTVKAAAPVPAPLDPAALVLAKWVSDNFDTLEHDDIAQFLVFGHGQFGRDG